MAGRRPFGSRYWWTGVAGNCRSARILPVPVSICPPTGICSSPAPRMAACPFPKGTPDRPSMSPDPQLNPDGSLRHLLTLDGLPPRILTQILDTAESFMDVGERDVKKVPLLRGKAIRS